MSPLPTNGEVYEAPWPNCLRYIIQWIGFPQIDTYVLLSTPEKSATGGTCMVVCTQVDGKRLYTQEELARRIEAEGWKKIDASVVLSKS